MEISTAVPALAAQAPGTFFEVGSLLAALAHVTDQRSARGVRYDLAPVLVLMVLAKLSGEDRPSGIAHWVSLRAAWLVKALGLKWKRTPHDATYRRVMASAIDVGELEAVVSRFLQPAPSEGVALIINLDGKSLRGTIPAGQTQGEHLLAAYHPEAGVVLLQIAVGSKENEISAAPRLLQALDLSGKIVTGDAMFAQVELSRQVVAAGGDYLWVVKDNQPSVRDHIETLFVSERTARGPVAHDFQSATTIDKGHGRLEQRTLTASSLLNEYLGWPGVGQVFEIEREVIELASQQRRHEIVYGISSLNGAAADAARLLSISRAHWGIENGLHYRRDVTFKEDATRMKNGTAAQVLAILNNLALGLIRRAGFDNAAEARRWFEARPKAALDLVLRC
ncbi:MAG: ISAs1 family transposase [Pyrinomonadaceae bacterium]|nr:ISAs1 family transposase [Pyrinomonadaceae bacterium]